MKPANLHGRLPQMSRFAFSVLLLCALSFPSAAATLEEADRAFDAGDHTRALALYEDVLASEPGNVRALVRSATLLSWEKKFDEAVARYDRALAADPENPVASRERAKVLSWSRRYREAAEAFRALLAREPGDREARLGLARTLSWSGRQEAAREEYERLLASDPGDVEALVGVAQTWAWSPNARKAYPAFERALEAEPESREARLGLAHLDLSAGDPAGAARASEELSRRFPNDPEVRELGVAASRALGPWILVGYDNLYDSDGNTMDTYRVEGGIGLGGNFDLRLGAARYDMANDPSSGHIDSFHAALGARIARRQRLEVRAGADRSVETDGLRRTDGIGGIGWTWGLGGDWSGSVSAQRDTLRYSVYILDSDVIVDAYAASAGGPIGKGFRVSASGSYWDLSDGNSRRGLEPGVWYRWPARPVRLETGYVFRWFDFAEDADRGYFDPSRYAAHILGLRASGSWGARRNTWEAVAEAGIQSYTQDSMEVSNDPLETLFLNVGFPLEHGLLLEAYGGVSNYAFAGISDEPGPPGEEGRTDTFRARQGGVRLRWRIGG